MDFEALSVILKKTKKKVQQQAVVVFVSRLYATVQLVGSVKLLDVGVDPNNLPNIGDKVIIQRPNEKQDWIITSTFTEPRLGNNVITKSTNLELIDGISLEGDSDYIYFTMDKVYTYFQLSMAIRSTRASYNDHVVVVLNDDVTAANYYTTNTSYGAGAWTANTYTTVGGMLPVYSCSGTTAANTYAISTLTLINIPGQYLSWQGQSFIYGTPYMTVSGGLYKQTNPITSVKIYAYNGPQLVTGSTAYLFAM